LLQQVGPYRWLLLGLGFVLVFLVFMNILNVRRIRRSAPPALLEEVRDSLRRGTVNELDSIVQEDGCLLSQSIRCGLERKDGQGHLDKSAVLRAWAMLTEEHRFWPRCLGCYGAALGISTFVVMALDTIHFSVLFWNKISTVARPPYLRVEVQAFLARLLLCAGTGAVFLALSGLSSLVFFLVVRSASHRSSRKIVDVLGAGGTGTGEQD